MHSLLLPALEALSATGLTFAGFVIRSAPILNTNAIEPQKLILENQLPTRPNGPWISTGSASDIGSLRKCGITPKYSISSVVAIHRDGQWSKAQETFWPIAVERLKNEAKRYNANGIIDINIHQTKSNDVDEYILSGTAVHIDGRNHTDPMILSLLSGNAFAKAYKQGIYGIDIIVGMGEERGYENINMGINYELNSTQLHQQSYQSAINNIQHYIKQKKDEVGPQIPKKFRLGFDLEHIIHIIHRTNNRTYSRCLLLGNIIINELKTMEQQPIPYISL